MKALLIIDIQMDYMPGGNMELVNSEAAATQAGKILARFRADKLPVFHVRHISVQPGATFFLPDTPGTHFHPAVLPTPAEAIITKHYPNSFRETRLLDMLKASNVNALTICGMMTHMCLDAGTRAAWDLGFTCEVIADACATRDLTWNNATTPAAHVQTAFLAALAQAYAKVINADDWLNG